MKNKNFIRTCSNLQCIRTTCPNHNDNKVLKKSFNFIDCPFHHAFYRNKKEK